MKTLLLPFILVLFPFAPLSAQQKIDRAKRPQPGTEPKIEMTRPHLFKMDNGLTIIIVENHKLPKVSASLTINRAPVYEGEKKGMMNIYGAMLSEGTTHLSKEKFDEEVDFLAATVAFSSSGAVVSSLKQHFKKAFMLMTDALLNPAFPEDSFEKLKTQTITSLKLGENNVRSVSNRVVNALVYGTDHPFGEFETEQTINHITLDDIKEYHKKNLIPNRTYLVVVGDVKVKEIKKLANKAFGRLKRMDYVAPTNKIPANVTHTEINFIDLPNAVQSELTISNIVNNTRKNPDYFPLLIANQILGGGSTGYLFENLREKHGYTYGAYSSVGANRYGSRFSANASVRNTVTDSAIVQMISEVKRIREEPVHDTTLALTKSQYSGAFVLSLENPATIANFALSIETEDLPKNFYRTFLQKLNHVTAKEVQEAAKQYFLIDQTHIVVVGKGEDIHPSLSKLGYPIKNFDKYAHPIK